MPSPGYVVGEATTAIPVVAPATLTVPLVHAPNARADPPMLEVVPASGRLAFTKASVAMLVELSLDGCVMAVAPLAFPLIELVGIVFDGKCTIVFPPMPSRMSQSGVPENAFIPKRQYSEPFTLSSIAAIDAVVPASRNHAASHLELVRAHWIAAYMLLAVFLNNTWGEAAVAVVVIANFSLLTDTVVPSSETADDAVDPVADVAFGKYVVV